IGPSVCPGAHGIGVAADSSKAYVSCDQSDEYAIVTLTEPFDVVRIPVGPGAQQPPAVAIFEPYALAVSPADGTIWTSNIKSQDVRVFDPITNTIIGTPISMSGGAPFFATFTADGATLIVPVQGTNALVFIDTASRTVTDTVLLPTNPDPTKECRAPHATMILPGGAKALVACEGDHTQVGTVAVVDMAAKAVEKVIPVGVFPDDL